jgi:uncharacterized pyridoxal phosphate-containing UPF0001 family protein
MNVTESARAAILARIDAAARAAGHHARLLAVSKTKPADAVRVLAAQGQLAFGENYVQEALAKQRELVDLALEWHLIGPLQSNKCREVALHFDWLQSLDRLKLVAPLARHRRASAARSTCSSRSTSTTRRAIRLRAAGHRRARRCHRGRRRAAPARPHGDPRALA